MEAIKIKIKLRCPFCNKEHYLEMDEDDYKRYESSDECIQNVLPNMSATDREKLISGMCEECQKDVFDSEEE